jgi:hypothetical protein
MRTCQVGVSGFGARAHTIGTWASHTCAAGRGPRTLQVKPQGREASVLSSRLSSCGGVDAEGKAEALAGQAGAGFHHTTLQAAGEPCQAGKAHSTHCRRLESGCLARPHGRDAAPVKPTLTSRWAMPMAWRNSSPRATSSSAAATARASGPQASSPRAGQKGPLCAAARAARRLPRSQCSSTSTLQAEPAPAPAPSCRAAGEDG